MYFKRIASVGAIAGLLTIGASTAAFAASVPAGTADPVTVTATVPAALSLTLNSSSMAFGTIIPGTASTATETGTVSGNSAYSLTVAAEGPTLNTPGPTVFSIPWSAVTVQDTMNGTAGSTSTFSANGTETLYNTASGPVGGTDTFSDSYSINAPGQTQPGNYSGTIDYMVNAG